MSKIITLISYFRLFNIILEILGKFNVVNRHAPIPILLGFGIESIDRYRSIGGIGIDWCWVLTVLVLKY